MRQRDPGALALDGVVDVDIANAGRCEGFHKFVGLFEWVWTALTGRATWLAGAI